MEKILKKTQILNEIRLNIEEKIKLASKVNDSSTIMDMEFVMRQNLKDCTLDEIESKVNNMKFYIYIALSSSKYYRHN